MTNHPKSRRVRIISPNVVSVDVGRGFVEFPPGWTGPVVPAVADYLEGRPDLAEVWRDGEPPAYSPGAQEVETAIRVVQTDDGPRFEEIEPPAFDPAAPDPDAP